MSSYEEQYNALKERVEQLIVAFEAGKEYQFDPEKFDEMVYDLKSYISGGRKQSR
mgnify:FL=1